MSKFQLQSHFAPKGSQPAAISELVAGIKSGLTAQTLLGVTGSGKTFTMAHVIAELQRPALILAHNKTLAAQLYGEMKDFFPDNAVEYFVSYYDYYQPEAYVPASDVYIEKDASINEYIEQMRLSATKALLERRDVVIVATVSAIYGLGDPLLYHKMVLHLAVGMQLDYDGILDSLANMQYMRNDIDFKRGTFRSRTYEVIDIFPAESERNGIRVFLDEDKVTKIAEFDPLTGVVIKELARTTVYPKTHYVTPQATIDKAIDEIAVELKQRLAELQQQNKLVEAQRLEQRVTFDLEMLKELGYCSGIENYSRYLAGTKQGEPPPTLFDYFPKDGILFIDESHVTVPQLGAMYKGDRARKENLVNYGFRLPSALDNRPLRFDEFEARQPQTIFVSATPADYEKMHAQAEVEQIVRPTGLLDPEVIVRSAENQVDDLLSEIKNCVRNQERVLVTTLTKRMSEDLTEYLQENNVKVRYLHSDIDTVERMSIIQELRAGKCDVLVGINLLREGLDLPEVALVAILDADKEGFLRSERSLIQTIGRAARNVNGRAILYANKNTLAIKRALDETLRRRTLQSEYNQQHNITPQTIRKKVTDVLEAGGVRHNTLSNLALRKYALYTPKKLHKELALLEKKMLKHAKNLEFEDAALIRDQIDAIKDFVLRDLSSK